MGGKIEDEDVFVGVLVICVSSDGFMDKGYDMIDVMVKVGVIFDNG